MSTVLVMWTAPSPPPTDGYQVQITRGSTTTTVNNVIGTSHTFSVNNQYGVYHIQVRSPSSPHFQSNEAAPEPVEITVRGNTLMQWILSTNACINHPESYIIDLPNRGRYSSIGVLEFHLYSVLENQHFRVYTHVCVYMLCTPL